MSSHTSDSEEPDPRALQLPPRNDCFILPELTPDGWYVHSTGATEYFPVSHHGWSPGQVGAWLLELTQDGGTWTPGFLDSCYVYATWSVSVDTSKEAGSRHTPTRGVFVCMLRSLLVSTRKEAATGS